MRASLGGLVVKQMLMQAAKDKECSKFLKKTAGVVCILGFSLYPYYA